MAVEHETLIALTTDIVTSHVGNNNVAADMLGPLIRDVFAALQAAGEPAAPVAPEKPVGAVSVRASVKPDRLISMIDGKPYRMLKRHLSLHGYTSQTYREAYGLAADYPMVAAEYAQKRRELAHQIGLGRKAKVEEAKPARKPRAKKSAIVSADNADTAN